MQLVSLGKISPTYFSPRKISTFCLARLHKSANTDIETLRCRPLLGKTKTKLRCDHHFEVATSSCLTCSVRADFRKLAKNKYLFFPGGNKLQHIFLWGTGPDLGVGPPGLGLRPRLGAPRRRQASKRHDQAWLGLHGPD